MAAMVKKASETTESSAEKRSSGKKYQLLYPVLIGCELLREMAEDEDKEPELFISATIKPIRTSDDLNVALCQFQAGEQVGNVETLKVIGTYYVALRKAGEAINESDLRYLMEQNAGVSAWPLFRTLYSQVVAQANEVLPPLAAEVDFEWEQMDAETSKE